MGTIANKLTYLNETKTAIKEAIVAKGVSVSGSDTFRSYANKIGQIEAGGGTPAIKFGASVDTFLGDVDDEGVLNKTTWVGSLDFSSVKTVSRYCLYYKFYECAGLTSVDFSSLALIDYNGMGYAFQNCIGLTSVDLSSLVEVGAYGLCYAFQGCSNIKSFNFNSLTKLGSNSLFGAFQGCTALKSISFPALTSVQTNSLGNSASSGAFRNCTNLTEIHFRADMQSTIEAMTQYGDRWGATNATIYFDL